MTADGLERTLIISLIGHLAIASVIFLRAAFVPEQPIEIRNAIKVDIVGLPEKMDEPSLPLSQTKETLATADKEKAPLAPIKESKVETPTLPDPKGPKKDLAKSQKRALEELKRRAALDRIREQLAKGKSQEPARLVRGNQISPGNALSGLDKIAYDRYFDELREKMRANFSLPQWLADAGYKAQIQVLIDERGLIVKKILISSSGNEVFDAKAIEAVDASAPLPAPPQRLQGLLSTSGIIFGFPE